MREVRGGCIFSGWGERPVTSTCGDQAVTDLGVQLDTGVADTVW